MTTPTGFNNKNPYSSPITTLISNSNCPRCGSSNVIYVTNTTLTPALAKSLNISYVPDATVTIHQISSGNLPSGGSSVDFEGNLQN